MLALLKVIQADSATQKERGLTMIRLTLDEATRLAESKMLRHGVDRAEALQWLKTGV